MFTRYKKTLVGITSKNYTSSICQNFKPTTLTAPCQRLNHPRSATCTMYAAQIYNPNICFR